MKKGAAKKIKINIKKDSSRKLVSPRLIESDDQKISKIIALAALLGFIVGGFIIAYVVFSNNPLDEDINPEIIVPEETVTEQGETNPPASTAPSTIEESQEPAVVFQQVQILETPTGYLNVRTGPGTNFEKITQVKPGGVYELVKEDTKAGWYEIRLDITTTGWITKKYARIN